MRSDRESPLRFERAVPDTSGQHDPKPRAGRERREHTDTGQPPGGHGPAPPTEGADSPFHFEQEAAPDTSGQHDPKPRAGRKRREYTDTGQPPGEHGPAPSTEGAASRLHFEQEAAPGTSGQHDPKPGGKYRQQSKQGRPSERLHREDEAPPGGKGGASGPKDKKAARADRRFEKSGQRAEKTGAKLGKAQDKLAAQKPPKKPGPIKAAGRAVGRQVHGYVHKKIHEVEHENVGTEAAHRTELAGEGLLRGGTRFVKKRIRTRPARQVRKWEKKDIKARAEHQFQKLARENPQLNSNPLSRFWQKRKLKKQYAKQAREAAKKGAKAAGKTATATQKVAAAAWGLVKRHPVAVLIILLLLVVVLILSSVAGAFTTVGNGLMGAVGGTSYLAEDADIDAAELAYTEWETDLYLEAMNAETSHPGYDEYRYSVADISHNPYELMAYLTAVFDDFTFAVVEAHLRQLFNDQYTLTFTEEIEVRYRTETRTDSEGNDYEVEVPYNWYILNVSLTAQSFTGIVTPRMDAEQTERYNVYMILKGNRQYLQSPFGETNWLPYVSSYYGYRVHPITGAKDYHKAVDIAMPEGTDILAGQDGTVTTAAWDNSYGWYVVLDDGEGLVSKYAHCSALLVSAGQTVQAGDVIARVGNTGTSTGAHLHLEIIKDGQYLNPLYFAVTNDFGQGPEYGDPGAAMGDGSYAAMIAEAERYLGYPYVWGGSSPSTSFDCSGYVSWVINQSGVGSVGRKTAQGLYNLCTPVSAADAQPGDLIFFTGTYSTPSACSHVGIYVGGGQMIHCASAGVSYASINTSYWQSHFYSFGRLP